MTTETLINYRYQLQDELGAGGMGAVYKARDQLTGEIVALKQVLIDPENLIFNSRINSQDNVRLALTREFQILATLRHPHIIEVKDYGFDQARHPFFTMSYLEGSPTLRVISPQKTEAEKLTIVLQLLQAIAYLHRRQVIHRDLKPENVLINDAGQVKLLDFGLAQQQTALLNE